MISWRICSFDCRGAGYVPRACLFSAILEITKVFCETTFLTAVQKSIRNVSAHNVVEAESSLVW